MGIFSTNKTVQLPPKPTNEFWMSLLSNDSTNVPDLSNYTNAIKAVKENPIVSFCINKRKEALANAKIEFLKDNGDFSTDATLKAKILQPNKEQTWFDFRKTIEESILIFGQCYIHGVDMVIGQPKTAKEFKAYNKNDGQLLFNDGRLKPLGLRLNDGAFIDYDKLLIVNSGLKDYNYPYVDLSPLVPIAVPISTYSSAYDARNKTINDRGAVGCVSPKSTNEVSMVPLLRNEIEEIKNDHQLKYGVTKDKSPFIFSNVELTFTRFIMSTDEMKLHEEDSKSAARICDGLSVKFELLANEKGVTFSNYKEARKSFYSEQIIPYDTNFYDLFTRWIGAKDFNIKCFYDHLDVFQEDEKFKADAKMALTNAYLPLLNAGLLTKNQVLKELGYDEVNDKAFNEYLQQDNTKI
jgi:hypothetical protein